MKLSGKKLTTAILAGLMGATVAGISVVGAANPVVLDGTTLKVLTAKGTKPIMNPVNVTHGIMDGTTTGGKIVKSESTVGANLDALDAAVVGKADKADVDAKANKTDFDDLKTKVEKAKVDTALHVDKDGKLVVGTDKNVNKAVSVKKGFKDGTTEAGQGNIVSADNTVGQNLTALDNAVATNQKAIGTETKERVAADQTLQDNIDAEATARDQAVAQERAERKGADAAQDKVIQQVNQNVADGFDTINKNIGTITDQLNKNDLAEQQARAAGDKAEAEARDAADKAEAKARANKDTEHDTAIAANKKAIGDEAAARQADISRLDNKIHDVSKEVDTVGALSMAMSGLHPLSYDEGDARFQLSAAVGTYDGTEALALGGFYHFNRDSMLSVGVATDLGADEHRMGANVGYTRRIGQGGHVSRPSEGTVSDIMKDIKNLEQKQAKLEQENEQLKQQLASLKK